MIYQQTNYYESVILQQNTDKKLSFLLDDGYKIIATNLSADKNLTEIVITLYKSEEIPVYDDEKEYIPL